MPDLGSMILEAFSQLPAQFGAALVANPGQWTGIGLFLAAILAVSVIANRRPRRRKRR